MGRDRGLKGEDQACARRKRSGNLHRAEINLSHRTANETAARRAHATAGHLVPGLGQTVAQHKRAVAFHTDVIQAPGAGIGMKGADGDAYICACCQTLGTGHGHSNRLGLAVGGNKSVGAAISDMQRLIHRIFVRW